MKSNEDSISLNKFISETGYCSRREADKIIDAGRVTLNRVVAKKGNRVFPGDKVELDGTVIGKKAAKIFLAFNKPKGITCTTDPRDNSNIIDYINYPERIYPIGRLDKDSCGLIFLTNNGDIVNKILRAEYGHEKEYVVKVNKVISHNFIRRMSSGVPILDRVTNKCFVEKIDNYTFRMVLTQGLNRQIRRMCEHFGYRVKHLKRVRIMNVLLAKLKEGKYRELSSQEQKELNKLID